MTVTMTIEEFDKLREEGLRLREIRKYLREQVRYTSEAWQCIPEYAWQYTKALDAETVSGLVKLVGVFPLDENITIPDIGKGEKKA